MEYFLKDGKRCYLDEKTGRVVVDNTSQEAADLRDLQYRGGYTPAPPPPSQGTYRPVSSPRADGTAQRLCGLIGGFVRSLTVAVTIGAILLIGAYCVKEPIRFEGSYHCEFRDTEGIAMKLEAVGERLMELFETEREELE